MSVTRATFVFAFLIVVVCSGGSERRATPAPGPPPPPSPETASNESTGTSGRRRRPTLIRGESQNFAQIVVPEVFLTLCCLLSAFLYLQYKYKMAKPVQADKRIRRLVVEKYKKMLEGDAEKDVVPDIVQWNTGRALGVFIPFFFSVSAIIGRYMSSMHNQNLVHQAFLDGDLVPGSPVGAEQCVVATFECGLRTNLHGYADDVLLCSVVLFEFGMLLQMLIRVLASLGHALLIDEKDHKELTDKMDEFRVISCGINLLYDMGSFSAVIDLPLLLKLPGEIGAQKAQMSNNKKGNWTIMGSVLLQLFWYLIRILFAICAVLIIVEDLLESAFSPGAVLGFAFSIASIVDFEKEKKKAFFIFVFGGEDALLEHAELERQEEFIAFVVKRLFSKYGAMKGVVLALSITADDLQQILQSK